MIDLRTTIEPKSDSEHFCSTPSGYYVYLHRRESDSSIFYVGKGKDRRAWGLQGRNQWWKRVSKKHGFRVQIVRSGLPEACSKTLERLYISLIGKENLVNLVDGGGGTPGWHHSAETRARIGSFHRGRKLTPKMMEALSRYNTGKKLSDDHKIKLSLAKKGKRRRPHSNETKAKISASHMGMRPSSETLLKLSESHKGKSVGRLSPSYDHTIRVFVNPKHGIFEGTRGDLIEKYDIGASCISNVISGKQKSAKGWRLA